MKTAASIAFLALVAPIFAVPFEQQLEARDPYNDDSTSISTVFHTKTSLFAIQTTQLPSIHHSFGSVIPSDFTIVPSATTTHSHKGPHHTTSAGSEHGYNVKDDDNNDDNDDDEEHKHTKSGFPHPSGYPHPSGSPHHSGSPHRSGYPHPSGRPDHSGRPDYSDRPDHSGTSAFAHPTHHNSGSFTAHPTDRPHPTTY